MNKNKYIVITHIGDHLTWAASPEKAIANVRWRLFGGACDNGISRNWQVKEV